MNRYPDEHLKAIRKYRQSNLWEGPRGKSAAIPDSLDAWRVYLCMDAVGEDQVRQSYGSLCHRFPLMVRRSGLATALLHFMAKADEKPDSGKPHTPPEQLLLLHLISCLSDELQRLGYQSDWGDQRIDASKLIDTFRKFLIQELRVREYCLLSQRVLAIGEWFKRYAESRLAIKRQDQEP